MLFLIFESAPLFFESEKHFEKHFAHHFDGLQCKLYTLKSKLVVSKRCSFHPGAVAEAIELSDGVLHGRASILVEFLLV